jgi:AraC-like DNA-binding protein
MSHAGELPEKPRFPLQLLDWTVLARSSGYSLERLTQATGFSLRTLQRHVSDRFGINLHAFISDLRMLDGAERLRKGMSVKEVAVELGFKNTSHFVRIYRAKFGTTPGVHAARMHNGRVKGSRAVRPNATSVRPTQGANGQLPMSS